MFMYAVSHLRKNGSTKTGNKISAAFRFFQNGVNEKSLESRFTAFWSALESLTLIDDDGPLRHDEHVIKAVIPCIAIDQRLSEHPYAQYRFSNFIELCSSPFELARKIEAHERKVELHIHRIYRVRNAIVHNASPHERLELLIVKFEAKRIFGEMDPSRALSGKKRNGQITSIKTGTVLIKDEQLVSWLVPNTAD